MIGEKISTTTQGTLFQNMCGTIEWALLTFDIMQGCSGRDQVREQIRELEGPPDRYHYTV
jgi:hypothetical protein